MRAAIISLFALTALSATLPAATPAHADPYRWCAVYGGMFGATNCYFLTIAQCRAAISGNGGFCNPNTFYDGRPVGAADGPVRRRKRAAY